MSNYSPIAALAATLLLTAVILNTRFGRRIQDIPNERSLHAMPTPRIGGIGLVIGMLCGWAPWLTLQLWWLLLPLAVLFAVSLLDDVLNLPVKQRLIAHLLAASIMVAGSGLITAEGVLFAVLVVLCTVWMTNLYNFMDGSDGLAGGMALFGFATYGIAAWMANNELLTMMNLSAAAAALGFLFYNFPPAKVFMGDAGSIPLGFLAAGMGLWGWRLGCWAAWFPLLVFSPFIVDASVTLLKRTLRGLKITEAHREHYYQHAIQMGLGHRQVALSEYALMLGVGASALWSMNQPLPWQVFLAWAGVYGVLMLVLDARWKTFMRGRNA